jgi:hypothetical protein
MRFRCRNPFVLHCTIVGRAIGEHQGYAVKISFRLVTHHKSMLCRSLLGGFMTYPFLYTCVGSWYLEMCGTYDASLLNEFFASIMVDQDRGWMYGDWKKSGAHTTEWMNKTEEFIDRAFSRPPDEGVKCPCSICRNAPRQDKMTLTLHLCKFGFMLGYEVWTHHNETVHQRTASVAEEEDDRSGDDGMDEMPDAIWPELETNHEDPPTSEV